MTFNFEPDPYAICLTHGRCRSCSLHPRAELPSEAAVRWLKKHCKGTDSRPCNVVYHCGVVPAGRVVGQRSK